MTRFVTRLALPVMIFTNSIAYSQHQDSLPFKKVTLNTSLTDYFPDRVNAGNLNMGTEIYLRNRKSVALQFGLIRSYGPSGGFLQLTSLSTQGVRMQVEGKHYFSKRKIVEPAILLFWPHIFQYKTQELQNTGYYIATSILYQHTRTDRQETIADHPGIYTVNRDACAAGIKLGYHCIKSYGLSIDYAIGIGIQYISSTSGNKQATEQGWPYSEKDIPWKKLFDSGAGIYPHFIYKVKLGWSL